MQTPQFQRPIGVFEDQRTAIEAARALLQAGFKPEHLVLVARDWKEQELTSMGVQMQKAAEDGAAAGAAIGGSIGVAVGLASILIPGVGLAAVALAAMGAATGAATGGVVGAFAGMELNESDARYHAEHVEKGRTVLVYRGTDRVDEARSIMVRHGAYDYSMSTD